MCVSADNGHCCCSCICSICYIRVVSKSFHIANCIHHIVSGNSFVVVLLSTTIRYDNMIMPRYLNIILTNKAVDILAVVICLCCDHFIIITIVCALNSIQPLKIASIVLLFCAVALSLAVGFVTKKVFYGFSAGWCCVSIVLTVLAIRQEFRPMYVLL